jgi:hypothetical protein
MRQKTSFFIVGTLLYSLAIPVAGAVPPVDEVTPPPANDTTDIKAYRGIVADIESDMGAYAANLPENLLSLGLALQQQERHTEALAIFKRGTHLARINNGLYSATQIPLIRGEITSHIARGELVEADQRQQYMHKVQLRSLNTRETRVLAMMQQAEWQHTAYELGIGEERYGRLLNMWDLYRGALTEIADTEGDTSVNLLSPLHGLLQTQYLISGYKMGDRAGVISSNSTFTAQQTQNRFNAYRARSYKQGNAVIRAIYDVENARADEEHLATAEALVMLGDWNLWHDAREPAKEAYQAALVELAELNDAEQQIERLFGKPRPLPAVDGAQPLPPVVSAEEGDILLEFDVTERGRVTDLVRLDETGEDEVGANRLMRTLRGTRFRPRFEQMNPVNTEKIVHAYKLAE